MSKHTKPTRCVNCGELPVIKSQNGHYKFKLFFKPGTCPEKNHIETHQHTKLKCVKEWNRYNLA